MSCLISVTLVILIRAEQKWIWLNSRQELLNRARYLNTLKSVNTIYSPKLERFEDIVNATTDWRKFSDRQKIMTENLVLLVGLLNKMCKVKLVLQSENKDELNKVNKAEVDSAIRDANKAMYDVA